MIELFTGIGTAVWLGILTSISPCPLATNIAAMSYISKQVENKKSIFISGLLYTIGRMLVYLILGLLLVNGLLNTPTVARFLQKYVNLFLGPILLVTGLILLNFLPMFSGGFKPSHALQKKLAARKYLGALFLGILFALSFCPISAALFFGSLLPLAVSQGSKFLIPGFYGFGTALPVMIAAFILALGTYSLSKIFNIFKQVEIWGRRVTGGLFVGIGIYYCIRYLF